MRVGRSSCHDTVRILHRYCTHSTRWPLLCASFALCTYPRPDPDPNPYLNPKPHPPVFFLGGGSPLPNFDRMDSWASSPTDVLH